MAYAEVLLVKPVDGLGAEGDRVKVRAGYARNYLLPEGIALPVTLSNRKYIDALQSARVKREAAELAAANATLAKLQGAKVAFAVKTGEAGKMFGAITVKDIHAKLAEQGIEVEQRKIHLGQGPVKVLGQSVAHIKLHADISFELPFEIVSLNPIEAPAEKKEEEDDEPQFDKKGRRLAKGAKRKSRD